MKVFLWLLTIIVTIYFTYTVAYAEANRLAFIRVNKSNDRLLLCEAQLAINRRYECRKQCKDEISRAKKLRDEVIRTTYGK